MTKQEMKEGGMSISIHADGYVSLTDLAKKNSEQEPRFLIQNWIRNQNTLEFLDQWERLYNDDFKGRQMQSFRLYAVQNRNAVTPKKYIQETGAIGLISTAERYGETYAHTDIALNFCYWLSPSFQVFLIKEFQRLKANEQLRLGDPFNIKRHLTSGNYSLLVSAILSQTDERLLTHPQPYKSRLPFAAESDMLNKIVFGNTAKEWRLQNTDKPADRNQRDYANVLDLTVLNNLEFLDSMLIRWDVEKEERQSILQETYNIIHPILKRSKTLKRLQELADNNNPESHPIAGV